MQDPDRAMEVYRRLLAEEGDQAALRETVARQIADRIAKIGQTLLTHVVADSRKRAVEADQTDSEASARQSRARPAAAALFGGLVRRRTPPPGRGVGGRKREESGSPMMVRVDRRRRPPGAMRPAEIDRDPKLLRRRAGEEGERAAQAADADAKCAHQRLADLFWMAAVQAEAGHRGHGMR